MMSRVQWRKLLFSVFFSNKIKEEKKVKIIVGVTAESLIGARALCGLSLTAALYITPVNGRFNCELLFFLKSFKAMSSDNPDFQCVCVCCGQGSRARHKRVLKIDLRSRVGCPLLFQFLW